MDAVVTGAGVAGFKGGGGRNGEGMQVKGGYGGNSTSSGGVFCGCGRQGGGSSRLKGGGGGRGMLGVRLSKERSCSGGGVR